VQERSADHVGVDAKGAIVNPAFCLGCSMGGGTPPGTGMSRWDASGPVRWPTTLTRRR
jgi:hypothetical protein